MKTKLSYKEKYLCCLIDRYNELVTEKHTTCFSPKDVDYFNVLCELIQFYRAESLRIAEQLGINIRSKK